MNFILVKREGLNKEDLYMCTGMTFVSEEKTKRWIPSFVCLDVNGGTSLLQPDTLMKNEDLTMTFITEKTEGFEMIFISNPGCKIDMNARISNDLDDADSFDIVAGNIEIEEIMIDLVDSDTTKRMFMNPKEE